MNNKLDRVLFFWLPILIVYLYVFNLVIEFHIIKNFFGTFPIWGWLIIYFAAMFLVKFYLKAFKSEDDSKTDYTARAVGVNSDVAIVFIFSVISFMLVMILLGRSLESAWK